MTISKDTEHSSDLLRLIDSTDDVIKTAKKHGNSLTGVNYYAQKFAKNHADSLLLLDKLRKLTQNKDSEIRAAVEEVAKYSEIYFNVNTSELDRAEQTRKIKFIYRTKILPNLESLPKHTPTDELFPLELVRNTRGYIETVANQAAGCYDLGWYDASAVMIRRLLETLIIECFETHHISAKIKNNDGYFFYLEDLINKFLNEDGSAWNIGRNTKKGLPSLKKIGDQSAHSRHFTAKKPDIDKVKDDLRVILEELVNISKLKR